MESERDEKMFIASTIIAVFMALIVIMIRVKASKRPVSAKKILLPPFFMSTGFMMFLYPPARIPVSEAGEAFIVGALFSLLLIKTSKFEIKNEAIYLKRSKAFIAILILLLFVRIGMKVYLGQSISFEETSGVFFILAFGMILPWRISMFITYRKFEQMLHISEHNKSLV
jgi:membrane protein CcdC involved in cytochrome C biogenesis